jgi:hypothetical protein
MVFFKAIFIVAVAAGRFSCQLLLLLLLLLVLVADL